MAQDAVAQATPPHTADSRVAAPPLNPFFFVLGVLVYTPLLVLYLSGTAGNFTILSLGWPAAWCLVTLFVPCLLWLRWRKPLAAFDTLAAAPALYIFVTATFLPVHGGALDGREFNVGKFDHLLHVGLMGLCALAALMSLSNMSLRNALQRFVKTLGLLALVASIAIALLVLPFRARQRNDSYYAAALSPNQNVIVLLLDMLEDSFASEYFKHNPNAGRTFDGFVFYKNAASFAPFTFFSYAGFMSGGYPRASQVHAGSVRDAIYYKENIIDDMAAVGFTTHYYSILPYENENDRVIRIPDDIGLGRKDSFLIFALTMRSRYLPYAYLPFSMQLTPWTQREFGVFSKADARDSFEWFLHNVQVDPKIDKGFVWFHSLLTHQPVRFDATGRFSMELKPDDVNGEIAFTFDQVAEFLKRLQKLGVYDNSLLIIMADHGYNIVNRMKHVPEGADYVRTPFGNGIYLGQYEPLLMVKKPHASGTLRYDDTAVTLLDLRKSLREFTSPGSGAQMEGFDFLDETGSSSRVVPVIKFVGGSNEPRDNEDYLSLENWRPDSLRLPLSKNYPPANHLKALSPGTNAPSTVH